MSTDKHPIPIPQDFKIWYIGQSHKEPTSEAYKEWKRRGQQLCFEVAYAEGYQDAAEAAYGHLSCQPSPGLRWNKIIDGQGPEEYTKVLLYWDGLQETDTGYLINNSWVNSSKEPHWALPSHWMPMPPKPGITPAPNCYPEGGGEGEEKTLEALPARPECMDTGNCKVPVNANEVTNCLACGRELRKKDGQWYHWFAFSFGELVPDAKPISAPEAQPIAEGKEVPKEIIKWMGERAKLGYGTSAYRYIQGASEMYHKMQEEMEQVIENAYAFNRLSVRQANDLLDSRNKNNDDAIEIDRLQEELKRCQENLTAVIAEALQKSKRLDEVEKEAGDYKDALKIQMDFLWRRDYRPEAHEIKKLLDQYR